MAVAQLTCVENSEFLTLHDLIKLAHAGKKDYQEKLFIRFQLSDYVPQDNFYRQLKSILDFSFLYASTSKYYGSEGRKSIDPVDFMNWCW